MSSSTLLRQTAKQAELSACAIPLRFHIPRGGAALPVCCSVPLPRGRMTNVGHAVLSCGEDAVAETTVLARWSDGSAKWVLVQGLIHSGPCGESAGELVLRAEPLPVSITTLRVEARGDAIHIDDGEAQFIVSPATLLSTIDNQLSLALRFSFRRPASIVWNAASIAQRGPLSAKVQLSGTIGARRGLHVRARLQFYRGTGLVRCDVTLHNARAARHRGGLWDLGDPASCHFRDLSLVATHADPLECVRLEIATDSNAELARGETATLVQHSSGGRNWRSQNHVDRHGSVPLAQWGYAFSESNGQTQCGGRASPTLAYSAGGTHIALAVPEFWQNFPQALGVGEREVRMGLFPREHATPHELQPGEQKRHTVWLQCTHDAPSDLSWVHQGPVIAAMPQWHAASGAWPCFATAGAEEELTNHPALELLAAAAHGEQSLLAKREAIDEYGWRNYGDVWGDHEGAFYRGEAPVISHYNNQFDLLYGALAQWLTTGDDAWWQVADPLARHVVDIDLYHTTDDKAAFSGGMFWHTDHYRTAATATHRTYSRANRDSQAYGGGPSCEHNYTTGLLHYYYLTGDDAARDAVRSLADWVIAMDDGRRSPWARLDDGPTGLATRTYEADYHGPGRGAGNSLTALLDAWRLTNERKYLDFAETIIRRVIHPRDDIAARDLLCAERRWSYTMFLVALDRYLDHKGEAGEFDEMYAYARASLLAYAGWMADHERPYLDCPDELEFVTETWAAQEVRKANVLRLAAADADEETAARFLNKADELANYAWQAWQSFPSRQVTRAIAILATEAVRERQWRAGRTPRPTAPRDVDFGAPQAFEPSLARVKRQLKSPRGWLALAGNIMKSVVAPPRA